MKHFAAASGCDNCYPVNVALTFAVKHVMEKFMLEISCLFFVWDAFLLSPSTLLSHCSPMCPIKYLRAGGQSAAVQVRGPSLSASLMSPLLSFKLWGGEVRVERWEVRGERWEVRCERWELREDMWAVTFVQYWTRIRIFKDRSSLIFVSTSSKDVEKWHGFWGGRGSSTMGLLATIVVS